MALVYVTVTTVKLKKLRYEEMRWYCSSSDLNSLCLLLLCGGSKEEESDDGNDRED